MCVAWCLTVVTGGPSPLSSLLSPLWLMRPAVSESSEA